MSKGVMYFNIVGFISFSTPMYCWGNRGLGRWCFIVGVIRWFWVFVLVVFIGFDYG